jgi:hypothetical protein
MSAHATLAIEASGLEVPGAVLLCTGRYPRGTSTSCSAGRRSGEVVAHLGVGMAAAIFLDATVVRMVLVPALMELFGRANWWIPRWLDRRLPRIDVERHSVTVEGA